MAGASESDGAARPCDEDLGPARNATHGEALQRYPGPGRQDAQAPLSDEERGGAMYLAGWVVRQELARAFRHEQEAVPLLQHLLLGKDERLSSADAAVAYLEARELDGGLLRVRAAVTAWFVAIEQLVRQHRTMAQLLQLRELVVGRCARAVHQSSAVAEKFAALLSCGEFEAPLVPGLAQRLATRYLHARAAAFKKEVLQAINATAKDVAIRTALKAGMVAKSGGKPGKKQHVHFSRKVLGELDSGALHGLLTAVATTSPELLDDMIKDELVALLVAYDPSQSGAKGAKKADLRTQLVAAIVAHDGFAKVDNPKVFKVKASV